MSYPSLTALPPPSFGSGAGAPPPASAPLVRGVSGVMELDPTIDLSRPLPMHTDFASRKRFDDNAELFAALLTLEALEESFIRGTSKPDEYTKWCQTLLGQIKTQESAMRSDGILTDIPKFVSDHGVRCPHALERLRAAVPATVVVQGPDDRSNMAVVAEAVQFFITAMDAIRLNLEAKDQLFPLISDILSTLNRCSMLPPGFEPKAKLQAWIVTLHAMRASDALTPEQLRQLSFDLETGYSEFQAVLAGRK